MAAVSSIFCCVYFSVSRLKSIRVNFRRERSAPLAISFWISTPGPQPTLSTRITRSCAAALSAAFFRKSTRMSMRLRCATATAAFRNIALINWM
ncbi:hypothetical protein D9M68_903340 [compost metagenome]